MLWECTLAAVHVTLVLSTLLFLRSRRRLQVRITWTDNSDRVDLGVEDLAEIGYVITSREVQV